jgi:hypothetical protein
MSSMIPLSSRTTRIALLVLAAIILVTAAVLRMSGIGTNPPGLWQDEASTGFDAYLLWTTGRDRAGKLLPVIAQSFGDFPLAGYRYLSAPIVGLFGLEVATERAVASITGTLMVAATGFFAWRVFGRAAAIGVMLSAAFTPMWIHFSRYGSEAILLPFCLIFGAGLIELGKKPEYRRALWAGAAVLAFSAYTYHAVKMILPLWMIGFLIYHWPLIKELWEKERKQLYITAAIFTVLVLPSLITALTPGGMARGKVVMAWHHYNGWNLYHSVLRQYLGYFEPAMVFIRGGPHLSQSVPGVGIWCLLDLPLMIFGLATMARGGNRAFGFIFYWLLIGPLPGGMTYETQNIGRAIAWLPAPQLISGIGFAAILGWAWQKRGIKLAAPIAAVIGALWITTAVIQFNLTLKQYPKRAEREFQYEISNTLRCARQHWKNNEKLIVQPALIGNEVVETFVGFFFSDLFPTKPRGQYWDYGARTVVGPGELYVMKPGPAPKGKKLCEVKMSDGVTVGFVYGQD